MTAEPQAEAVACPVCGALLQSGGLVTIPAADYRRLVTATLPGPALLAPPSRSPIRRDAELSAFLIGLAGRGDMHLHQMREACRARFGDARTPSRSALHRFIQRERRARGGK